MGIHPPPGQVPESPTLARRIRRVLVGEPRDLQDRSVFHRLALIPFLAWVGLGADGLSSSAYGPEEAFRQLGRHSYLAVALSALMATTVLLISAAYRRIIEEFPSGGGGYVVATKLLGERAGLVSGSALLVDYVLTITISIAAAGDALFSLMPAGGQAAKWPTEVFLVLLLTVLNLRGVKESVLALMPVFLLFLVTHALVIGGGILGHLPELGTTARTAAAGFRQGAATLGIGGMLLLFLRAYSLGGGTYTGIEAVSNGLPIMREPRVETGKRTMIYMGASLAFTASGLLLCYLLWHLAPVAGKTMNAVLVERLAGGLPLGPAFVGATLFSEAMLLVVAAQAGFVDGPRVLSNMAVDSWVPHRFAALSDRLTTQNGIFLMGLAAMAALFYTRGDVGHLVVMYSINVFLTFSLSMFAMFRFWRKNRGSRAKAGRRMALFGAALVLCVTILAITVVEKFLQGGWVTVTITLVVVAACLLVRRHYQASAARVDQLYRELGDLPVSAPRVSPEWLVPDPTRPTAVILVESYGGVGIHTTLNVFRAFPGHFNNVVFASVGVVDSGEFKGENAVEQLRERTGKMLARYRDLATGMGIRSATRMKLGTEVVAAAEELCLEIAREFPHATFFTGKMIFQRPKWWHRLLHNETARTIQERLQWAGQTMVTVPIRVRDAPG
ncbi:MAG: amino acid transporter [Gemmatimonadetes bacterium]|nr:MAG: amino acid transporter [Gemmatimonadota bacterium]